MPIDKHTVRARIELVLDEDSRQRIRDACDARALAALFKRQDAGSEQIHLFKIVRHEEERVDVMNVRFIMYEAHAHALAVTTQDFMPRVRRQDGLVTVRDLITELSQHDLDRVVVLQKDAEGNEFSPFSTAYSGAYVSERSWNGEMHFEELDDYLRELGFTEDDIRDDGVPALALVPRN